VKFLRFRTLDAPANPLLEKYTAATGQTVEHAVADSHGVATPDWLPVDTSQWQPIFTAMAHHAENPGVTDHTDHAPANRLGH